MKNEIIPTLKTERLILRGITPEDIPAYAFNQLGFEKLIFSNAVGNLKSRRIKEKAGARLIDVRPAKFVNPEYTEHEVWELLKTEWTDKLS